MVIIEAESAYPDELQDTIDDEAVAGDEVVVPEGSFDWVGGQVTIPTGITVRTNSLAGCRGHADGWSHYVPKTFINQTLSEYSSMFRINGKDIRISGVQIKCLNPTDHQGTAIQVLGNSLDWRIDHCSLIDIGTDAIYIGYSTLNPRRGVVDHCYMAPLYKDVIGGSWSYGVSIGSNNYWDWDDDITHFLGKYETIPLTFPVVYVEDCDFYKTRHAIASGQLGWYCFRFNKVFQMYNSGVDVHGGEANAAGGRGGEVYGNLINAPIGVGFRGGSGVIYDNDVSACLTGVQIQQDSAPQLRPLNDLWIWNNIGSFQNTGPYIEGQDYFLRAPDINVDGFSYPSYPDVPYTYPHRLITDIDEFLLTLKGKLNSNELDGVPITINGITVGNTPMIKALTSGLHTVSVPEELR